MTSYDIINIIYRVAYVNQKVWRVVICDTKTQIGSEKQQKNKQLHTTVNPYSYVLAWHKMEKA